MKLNIKQSAYGNHLIIGIPFLGIETIAKNRSDVPQAVLEAVICFYIATENLVRV